MIEIIAYILMVLCIAYVLVPLFRPHHRLIAHKSANQNQWHEWLYRKRVALEIIADLEFDRQTGKLSDDDYRALKDHQQRLMGQLDEKLNRAGGQKDELSKRLMAEIDKAKQQLAQQLQQTCPQCGYRSSAKAKFCSQCGAKLDDKQP